MTTPEWIIVVCLALQVLCLPLIIWNCIAAGHNLKEADRVWEAFDRGETHEVKTWDGFPPESWGRAVKRLFNVHTRTTENPES